MCTGLAATGRYGTALDGRHGLKPQLTAHGTDDRPPPGRSSPGLNPSDREVVRVRTPPRAPSLTWEGAISPKRLFRSRTLDVRRMCTDCEKQAVARGSVYKRSGTALDVVARHRRRVGTTVVAALGRARPGDGQCVNLTTRVYAAAARRATPGLSCRAVSAFARRGPYPTTRTAVPCAACRARSVAL